MTITLKKKVTIKKKMRTAEQESRHIRIINNLNKEDKKMNIITIKGKDIQGREVSCQFEDVTDRKRLATSFADMYHLIDVTII